MNWSKHKKLITRIGAAMLGFVVVYLFVFKPVMLELKQSAAGLENIKAEVSRITQEASSLGIPKHRFFAKGTRPQNILRPLAQHESLRGLTLISMDAKSAAHVIDAPYELHKITLRIQSAYQKMGIFMGLLSEQGLGIILVENFTVTPSEADSSEVTTHLTLNMYVENS